MKDPSSDILTAIQGMLTSITYDSETITVYKDAANINGMKKKFILLNDITLSDSSTGDTNGTEGSLEIEVHTSGWGFQGNRACADSISSQILQALVRKNISMTSYTVSVMPYLQSVFTQPINTKQEIEIVKLIRLNLEINEN